MARLSGAREAQARIAQTLVKSITAVSGALGAQPIPLADLPFLLTFQVAMVAGIIYISGREMSLKLATEFLGTMGINVGVGLVFREGCPRRGAPRWPSCSCRGWATLSAVWWRAGRHLRHRPRRHRVLHRGREHRRRPPVAANARSGRTRAFSICSTGERTRRRSKNGLSPRLALMANLAGQPVRPSYPCPVKLSAIRRRSGGTCSSRLPRRSGKISCTTRTSPAGSWRNSTCMPGETLVEIGPGPRRTDRRGAGSRRTADRAGKGRAARRASCGSGSPEAGTSARRASGCAGFRCAHALAGTAGQDFRQPAVLHLHPAAVSLHLGPRRRSSGRCSCSSANWPSESPRPAPGTKDYGILSVVIGRRWRVELLRCCP